MHTTWECSSWHCTQYIPQCEYLLHKKHWVIRKTDCIHHHHHHHPEGVVYKNTCFNSSIFALSETAARRWWCIESFLPVISRIVRLRTVFTYTTVPCAFHTQQALHNLHTIVSLISMMHIHTFEQAVCYIRIGHTVGGITFATLGQ